jgi:frataxin-like iron-binding protein CyaY
LFKRVGPKCSTNYSYSTCLKHTAQYLARLAMSNGKKCQIVNKQNPSDDMWYYYSSHDMGYTFVFENNSESTTLDEYIFFDKLENSKLTNSDLEVSKGEPFWKFTVPPKSKIAKHLRRKTIEEGFSMSYKMSHEFLASGQVPLGVMERHAPENLSEKQLLEITKNRGEKYTFKCPTTGKELKISYRSMFFQTFYVWYFENDEESFDFDCQFLFKLKNLKLDHSDEKENNAWKVKMKPKEHHLKKMFCEDNSKGVSYSVSMSYLIKRMS